jgi:serine/threonine-protein kinase HipA
MSDPRAVEAADVYKKDWPAGRIGVRERAVARALDRLCGAAPAWIERLPEIGFGDRVTRRLEREITARREALGRAH